MKPSISRPVLMCWLLLGSLTSVPYLRAALEPPRGYPFAGTFHWIDDFYHYASYVQQSEDGSFLFRNKLVLEDHRPALVNLEWWVVGKLSWLCGRRPFLGYRIFALCAFAGLLWGLDRAFRRCGLPPAHRFPALLLLSIAGGPGGLLFELTPRPVFRCVDLSVGLFPFLELLANPHWLAGTWLLLESILAYAQVRSSRDWPLPTLLGSALAVTRPYDFVLVPVIHSLSVVVTEPPQDWFRKWLPLVGLAPAALYNYWVFYRVPAFASFATTAYAMPETADFLLALLPALLLALLALRPSAALFDPDRLRPRMWVWAVVGFLIVALRPVAFSQQFAIGLGLPLLFLGAMALARYPPVLLAAVALVSSSTAVVALRVVLRPDPQWFVPAPRMQAALALRPSCRPGDLVLSPADIGLYSLGLTACHAFVSHPWAPRFEEREQAAAAFYGSATVAERRSLLDEHRVTHLVLPGDPGGSPDGWLGEGSGFLRVATVGTEPTMLSLYARSPSPR
jgi:hypothetical protein